MSNVVPIHQARMHQEAEPFEIDASAYGGYVKIFRSIQKSKFRKKALHKATWLHMLIEAQHAPYTTMLGRQQITLQSGQFISSREQLIEEIDPDLLSDKRMRNIIEFFVGEGMITTEPTRNGTIFTIVNYAFFQGNRGQYGANIKGQEKGQQEDQRKPSNDAGFSLIEANEGANTKANIETAKRASKQEDNKITTPYGVEPETAVSDALAAAESKPATGKATPCPHKQILAIWDEVMPGNIIRHQESTWDTGRAGYRNLAARWKQGFSIKKRNGDFLYTDLATGLKWWRDFFVYLAKSEFLIDRCRPFSLEWICKRANFDKAKDGNYHA